MSEEIKMSKNDCKRELTRETVTADPVTSTRKWRVNRIPLSIEAAQNSASNREEYLAPLYRDKITAVLTNLRLLEKAGGLKKELLFLGLHFFPATRTAYLSD